jgi:hypothetical protein
MSELFDEIRAGDEHAAEVYADLVEQQGDLARAMLIRLQRDGGPAWERDAVEARWEVEQLLALYGDRWRAELPSLPGVTWLEFERGFVASARVTSAAALHEHAEAIMAASPELARIVIPNLDEREMPARTLPWLRTLCIEVSDEVHPHPVQSLLKQCTALEVMGGLEDVYGFLDGYRGMKQLERFAALGEHTGGVALGTRIATNPSFRELRVLELGTRFVDYNYGYYGAPTLREEGATLLATSGIVHLEVLDLTRQRVGNAGLARLLHATPQLRELSAGVNDLTNLDAFHHDGAPIDRLDLTRNAIGDAGIVAIANAPRLATLKHLVLDTCELGANSIGELTTAPCWQTLRILDISNNPLGYAAMLGLATAARPAELHTLKLADCEIGSDGMSSFATCSWLDQVLELDLSKLPVEQALLDRLTGVRSLRLAGSSLDSDTKLAATWERAVHLDLRGVASRSLLSTGGPELQSLVIAASRLDSKFLDQLVAGSYPRLRDLDVSDNVLDERVINGLIRSALVAGLKRLSFRGTKLEEGSIRVLAVHGVGALDVLDLRDAEYSWEELIMIARSPALRAVKRIALHGRSWEFPTLVQGELVERFGERWNQHDDEPIDDDEGQ